MKIKITIALLFAYTMAFGQSLRYEGAFPNAQKEQGTANYTYYKDATTGRIIKDGSFRYRVKIKNSQSRLYRNITGEYKVGWKTGLWEYSYSTKDYNTNNDGYFYSYNVILKANYSNGWPNGEWYYTAEIKRRKKSLSKGQTKWFPYEIIANTQMRLHYNMGELVDSLTIRRLDRKIDVLMDHKGFMKGVMTVTTDSSNLRIEFKDGFVIKTNNPKNDIVNQLGYYNYYKKYSSNLAKAGARLDTTALTFYSDVFMQNIFNDKYFNYRFIDGDRIVSFQGNRNKMKVQFMGLYKRELHILISKDEESLIRGISAFSIDASRKASLCAQKYKNSNKDIELRKKMDMAKAYDSKLKAYTCLLKLYRTTILPQDLAKKSTACNTDIKISASQTRLQILQGIYSKAKALATKSKAIKCD